MRAPPDYLIKRHGVWYYSRRVPAKLASIIGPDQWRETTGTSDLAAARKEAARINADNEAKIAAALIEYRRQRSAAVRLKPEEREVLDAFGSFDALRKQTVGPEPIIATVWRKLPERHRQGLPREWSQLTPAQQSAMSAFWARRTPDTDAKLTSRALAGRDLGLKGDVHLAEAVADMLSNPPQTRQMGHAANGTELVASMTGSRADFAAEGIDLDELQDEAAQAEAKAATLRARLERHLAILRKGTDDVADPELESDDLAAQAATADMQTVLDRWAHESGAPAQHVGQYGYAVKRFHELHGRLVLKDITRAHLRQFKDAIAKLPRSTRADIRAATLARAVSIADREDLPRIEEKTTRKHVMALSTLLSHAVGWGYIDTSPADGLRFLKRRQKHETQNTEPKGFTPAQLRTLDASLSAEYKDADDDRWLPIVCAYQGCRQEEACQLLKGDVWQHESGVWVMKITDRGEDQKVKNKPSVRTMPIHSKLIARGFLAHVERSPGSLVFASLKPDSRGRLGGPYGKRFARHLAKRAKITGMTFHDTRHAWQTAARNAELPQEIRRAIMGHRQEHGTPEDYGEKQGPVVLARHLNRVDPFAELGGFVLVWVILSHL